MLLTCALLLVPMSQVLASDVPPAGSKSLSAILKAAETQDIGVIAKAEFDDGLWQLKAFKDSAWTKHYLDPKSGEEKRKGSTDSQSLPPANALPLSTIVQAVEARGLGTITEVEFSDSRWEVDIRKDGQRIRLELDPLTGETKRERKK